MIRFESLPGNVRALLLARLGMEMKVQRASNIHVLAKMHGTDVTGIWRKICLRVGQQICSIPNEVIGPRSSETGGNT